MKPILASFAVTLALGYAALPGTAPAQQANASSGSELTDVGAQERISFSDKLGMLSQHIPTAGCHLAKGIAAEGSLRMLASAVTEFDSILTALEFGDPSLNINGPEERRRTIAEIQNVRETWMPLKAAAEAMVAGDTSDENLQVILDENMKVLNASQNLVSEITAQYSNPADLVQADGFLISIVGRQRMLTQTISKESCVLTSSQVTPETAELLSGAIATFGNSLIALRDGMPSVGVRRPPTAEISDGLEVATTQWDAVVPTLNAVLDGSEINNETAARKFRDLNMLMVTMNGVTGMYAAATKR